MIILSLNEDRSNIIVSNGSDSPKDFIMLDATDYTLSRFNTEIKKVKEDVTEEFIYNAIKDLLMNKPSKEELDLLPSGLKHISINVLVSGVLVVENRNVIWMTPARTKNTQPEIQETEEFPVEIVETEELPVEIQEAEMPVGIAEAERLTEIKRMIELIKENRTQDQVDGTARGVKSIWSRRLDV